MPIWRELRDTFDQTPLAQFLGFTVEEVERGRARVALTLRPEYANFAGMLHGGLVLALADHAFGCAANTLGQRLFAIQFNTYFLAPAPLEGRLFAEAVVEHAGRRLVEVRITVTDERERVISRSTGLVTTIDSRP